METRAGEAASGRRAGLRGRSRPCGRSTSLTLPGSSSSSRPRGLAARRRAAAAPPRACSGPRCDAPGNLDFTAHLSPGAPLLAACMGGASATVFQDLTFTSQLGIALGQSVPTLVVPAALLMAAVLGAHGLRTAHPPHPANRLRDAAVAVAGDGAGGRGVHALRRDRHQGGVVPMGPWPFILPLVLGAAGYGLLRGRVWGLLLMAVGNLAEVALILDDSLFGSSLLTGAAAFRAGVDRQRAAPPARAGLRGDGDADAAMGRAATGRGRLAGADPGGVDRDAARAVRAHVHRARAALRLDGVGRPETLCRRRWPSSRHSARGPNPSARRGCQGAGLTSAASS